MIGMNSSREVVMSFVSFDQSRDIIQRAVENAKSGENLGYLTAMVNVADKEMVAALAKRYKVSQGFVVRAIFDQWREAQLAAVNGELSE